MRKQANTYFLLLSFFALAFFNACEKKFDWQFEDVTQDILAVEGVITNQNVHQKIRLTLVRGNPNMPATFVNDAIVSVSSGGQIYNFAVDSSESGTYISSQAFKINVGAPAELEVVYEGITYMASDVAINVTATYRISPQALADEQDWYAFPTTINYFYSSEQAMWVVDADWSFLPEFADSPADSCKARVFYFSLKNIDVSHIFAPARQQVKVPLGAQINQTKYALSGTHAEFWRSVLLETEWRGSMFDVSQGEIPTNISGRAVGFFGASAVIQEVFIVGQ